MAFQLRRGTNKERLGITPVEGEIIYVTDSQLTTVTITTIAGGTTLTADETHGLDPDQALRYFDNSSYGFTENTVYYVLQDGLNETQFKLSLTKGGTPVTTFTNGSGLSLRIATGPSDAYQIPLGFSINPIWVGDGTTLGGLPAGASTLDELADVTIGYKDQAGIPLDSFQHLEYDNSTNQWRNNNDFTNPGWMKVLNTTDSTSTTTGALIVSGGAGFAKTVQVGSNLRVYGSQDATTKDTGALKIENGGLGVELQIQSGGNITSGGNIAATGSLSAGTSLSVGTTATIGTNATVGGDLAVNGGDITTTSATLNLATSATSITTGGQLNVGGDVKVGGNDIRASDGTAYITFDTTNVRTKLSGDLQVDGQDIRGADGTTALFLSGNGNVTVNGDLKITGNDIISSSNQTVISLSGTDATFANNITVPGEINLTGSQPFVNFNLTNSQDGFNSIRGMRGQVTVDDYWFVGAGSTSDDKGYLMLAVSDNGNDPNSGEQIIVRKYGGTGTTHNTPWDTSTPIIAELKLLDIDSNTSIPNSLTVGSNLTVDTDTLIVDATNNRVGVGITPTVKLDVNGSGRFRGTSVAVDGLLTVGGDATITGNLTVNGTTTTINSTTVTVDDKNIELGSVETPTDLTADGGGITLKGSTDKTIIWENANDWWKFNQAVSAVGLYAGYIQISSADPNTITTSGGDLLLDATGVVQVKTDLIVEGNLDVVGQLHFHDNFPVLNYGVTGAPSTNAGIAVNRGTSLDTVFRWNESTDRWQSTVDGTNYIDLPNQGLDTTSDADLNSLTLATTLTTNDLVFTNGKLYYSDALNQTVVASTGNKALSLRGNDNTTGNITLDGNVTLGYTSANTLTFTGTVNDDITFANNKGINFTAGTNDFARVRAGGTADAGYIEIATADNGSEQIHVRQYTGNYSTILRTLTLLDNQGDTRIPKDLYVSGIIAGVSDIQVDGGVNLNNIARHDAKTVTTTSTTTTTLLQDSITLFRSQKLMIQAVSAGESHTVEMLMTHNGTTAVYTTYGEIYTGNALFSVACDISSGYARVLVTPASATSTVFKAERTAINA